MMRMWPSTSWMRWVPDRLICDRAGERFDEAAGAEPRGWLAQSTRERVAKGVMRRGARNLAGIERTGHLRKLLIAIGAQFNLGVGDRG